MAKVRVKGIDRVKRNFNKAVKVINVAVSDGMFDAAEDIRQTALPLTPYKSGKLRDSSYAISRTKSAGDTRAKAAQGQLNTKNKIRSLVGYFADYAVPVHENLEARHKAPTRHKFLEQAVTMKRPTLLTAIAKPAQQKLK